MKILVKFPTRSRKDKFFNVLDMYYSFADDIDNMEFMISCDKDDVIMNTNDTVSKLHSYKNLIVIFGNNKNKIEAINSDLKYKTDYDIILLASDDMIPIVKGYDTKIRNAMVEYFPDTDGVLWFPDGYQNKNLNTLSILGKKYFERFGYIYHPSYKSLWCDNEFQEVASSLGKIKYIDEVIIKHEHPSWGKSNYDNLYLINNNYNNVDYLNYINRKKNNFI